MTCPSATLERPLHQLISHRRLLEHHPRARAPSRVRLRLSPAALAPSQAQRAGSACLRPHVKGPYRRAPPHPPPAPQRMSALLRAPQCAEEHASRATRHSLQHRTQLQVQREREREREFFIDSCNRSVVTGGYDRIAQTRQAGVGLIEKRLKG